MNKTITPSSIYVAGHRGLVGSAILRKLKQEGYKNIITRTSDELDLRNQNAVNDFFAENKPDWVFMAAARVGGILANSTQPADFIRDNLQIQTNIIDSAWRHGTQKLLFLGSSCIYPRDCPQPIREEYLMTGPLEPTNSAYAIAKIAGIEMCKAYRRQYGFDAISVMPTNLYGPNDNFDLRTSHVLPALIRKYHLAKLAFNKDIDAIIEDENRHGPIPDEIVKNLGLTRINGGFKQISYPPKIILWGTGTPKREFLYSDDLADACIHLMLYYSGESHINVGSGKDISIKELSNLISEEVGFSGETIWDKSRPDGTPRKLLDTTKITKTKWMPQIELKLGINKLYKSYINSNYSPQ